jgi:hypothetical protein
MKKVVKIITFYDDGTFSESVPSQQPAMPIPAPYVRDTPWPDPFAPKWEPVQKCSKCGLELKGAMGYVCSNYPCPSGLGGAWCGTGVEK